MKRTFCLIVLLIVLASLLPTPAFAAQTTELGFLKICKVAGTGVSQGQLFTFRVGTTSYSVPAGSAEGGYCVLAGQYPVNTPVTIQELTPAGFYVSRIQVNPERDAERDLTQGSITLEVGSGVTEVIFTNKSSETPTPTRTPTPLVTPTQQPTKTPMNTPGCSPNCTPTPTLIPRGRLQICKEAEGPNVTGYFTFRYLEKSVSIPTGACAGLISVDAGSLTITEDPHAGFSVSDIYTIPANRLISKDPAARSATVSIVEGNAATQTIVIFRNRAVTNSPTNTPTSTPTNTPTSTPTFTPTNTPTSPACVPEVVVPNFGNLPVGSPVEGLGVMDPRLDIQARGTAIHVHEGVDSAVYGSIVNGVNVYNAGMLGNGGFSDKVTQAAGQAHQYTFNFASGVAISNFSLRMLDYGDYNPTGSGTHLTTMTAYNAAGGIVDVHELSFTSTGLFSPQYGDLEISGDAVSATPGQPGNWTWNVSGSGIVRVDLVFGAGYDPNIAFDSLSFSVGCP